VLASQRLCHLGMFICGWHLMTNGVVLLIQYTGKSKEEMRMYSETGPGVGGRQGAGDVGVANSAPNGGSA
jgi:hypothetical protein